MWTVEKVKDELPEVSVKLGNDIFVGHVYGRKNRFATVSVSVDRSRGTVASYEFAWETIVNSLNNGRALTF